MTSSIRIYWNCTVYVLNCTCYYKIYIHWFYTRNAFWN